MKIHTPDPDLREPARAAGAATAGGALVFILATKLAGADPEVALGLAALLGPIVTGELARLRAYAPATVARLQAARGSEAPPVAGHQKRDPGWLRRYWPLGLALAGLAFIGPEAFAIMHDGEGGTLSEWSRDQLGTEGGAVTVPWLVLTAGLVAFAVWFPVHLRRGWPWEKRD